MGGFELTVEHLDGGGSHVVVHGSLDVAYAYRFDEAVRQAEHDGHDPIVIDLSRIDFIDSTGLARLVAARRRARRAGRRLVLVRGPTAVQRLFAAVALDDHFEIVSTAADVFADTRR